LCGQKQSRIQEFNVAIAVFLAAESQSFTRDEAGHLDESKGRTIRKVMGGRGVDFLRSNIFFVHLQKKFFSHVRLEIFF
jgi:hypothetical protein